MGEWVKYQSLGSITKVTGSFSLYFIFKISWGNRLSTGALGLSTKVIGRQTSNQTELFGTILGNWNYLTISWGMFINFFFSINFMGNVY